MSLGSLLERFGAHALMMAVSSLMVAAKRSTCVTDQEPAQRGPRVAAAS